MLINTVHSKEHSFIFYIHTNFFKIILQYKNCNKYSIFVICCFIDTQYGIISKCRYGAKLTIFSLILKFRFFFCEVANYVYVSNILKGILYYHIISPS